MQFGVAADRFELQRRQVEGAIDQRRFRLGLLDGQRDAFDLIKLHVEVEVDRPQSVEG